MDASYSVRFTGDSTSAAARKVIADALRKADPVGARAAEHETNWRRNYLNHYRRAVEAGIGQPADAESIARNGVTALREQMVYGDVPVAEAITRVPLSQAFHTIEISGEREPDTELSIPYRGKRLYGQELADQLDAWVDGGIITSTCRDAVRKVQENPAWLSLPDRSMVVLGAGAEMSPLRALLRWGADVVAVDLPEKGVQERIHQIATDSAGRVRVPARIMTGTPSGVGADLTTELPAVAEWLEQLPGPIVIGNYCYADGARHVIVSTAADALLTHMTQQRPDTALAFLATPTDVFVVPREDVEQSVEAYTNGGVTRVLRQPLRAASGGRLLQRNYPPQADPGVCDALVPQQGPNYALAKRLQRWRATVARRDGIDVSMNVAPSTRTRSVIKNKALAAAYAGAHRFGVEVFDPATSNTLMAAVLVHDLYAGPPAHDEPWQDEAYGAAHGGLWTGAYHPRSALGLAAVLGLGSLRP